VQIASVFAQKPDSINQQLDSLYIEKFENRPDGPLKLLHAEPLYIDLIRDLGARKGEKEWNFGFGLTDNLTYDEYEALVEYEWAPVNRLGFEIELPFHFYYTQNGNDSVKNPGSRLSSLKLASQYTFLVNEQAKTSLAIGYIHEFLMPAFRNYKAGNMLAGHLMEPFLVAAKRWGSNFHTLVYTGPIFEKSTNAGEWNTSFQGNASFHYMIPGTRNFIGVETNSLWRQKDFDMVIRPQMRVGLADNLLVGVVAGIPFRRENQRLSSFVRIIYEPAEHNRKMDIRHPL
jgi:hypothetical protein